MAIDKEIPKEDLKALVKGELPWEKVKDIVSGDKDLNRFEKVLDIYQEEVEWKEKIIIPLTDRLFVVKSGEDRIVKCKCGHEFGDYRKNWKTKALINVLNEEEVDNLYLEDGKPDLDYNEIREFYCPSCGAQLEVESVPRGYPLVFDFLPDIDSFYRKWLGEPLESEMEFKDLTLDVIKKWKEGGEISDE